MKNKSSRIKRGDLVQLTEDIMPIPSGVYKVENVDASAITLRPGKKSGFTLVGEWQAKIKLIPEPLKHLVRTDEKIFVDRYFDYLRLLELKNIPFNSFQPVTLCFLHPSLCRQTQELLDAPFVFRGCD